MCEWAPIRSILVRSLISATLEESPSADILITYRLLLEFEIPY